MRIARVVTRKSRFGERVAAGYLRSAASSILKAKRTFDVLVTHGGFLQAETPAAFGKMESGWDSKPADMKKVSRAADDLLSRFLRKNRLYSVLANVTQHLTVGLDFNGHPGSDYVEAEMVAVVDVHQQKILKWTGKSYPTSTQEDVLFQVQDIGSHLITLGADRIMVLGCHDLNMFSPRARANQRRDSERFHRCEEFTKAAAKFKPTIVLQHPHTTDTPNIWAVGWSGVRSMFPSASYCSGVCYSNPNGRQRSPLTKVLAGTKGGPNEIFDIVMK